MPYLNGKYYTDLEIEAAQILARENGSDNIEKFLVSAAIGAVTGSTIIGGLVGGSFLGGLLGDAMEGDDDSWL